jgi:uncharacterized integral membrane protein (TIGR00698 family)
MRWKRGPAPGAAVSCAPVSDGPPPARKTFLENALLGVPFREAHRLLPGAALAAAVVAGAVWGAAALGGCVASKKSPVAGPTLAILLGLLLVNTVGVAGLFKPGLDFCVRKVLRLGIVLVGIRLSFLDVARAGGAAVPAVLLLIVLALAFTAWLGRRLGVSPRLAVLAAASTAICGVTATLAVAPAIEAEDREVAYTVANVTLYGILGMLLYPFVAHALFAGQPAAAGLFLGTSIHETAQVTGAALCYRDAFADPAAMDAAIVAKLVRNTFLVAVVPFLAMMHARRTGGPGKRVPLAKLFPVFVLGFLGMAVLRSAGDAGLGGAGGRALGLFDAAGWKAVTDGVAHAGTDYGLGAAMAALGLTTRFGALREMGVRPLLLGAGAATAVAGAALGMAMAVARFHG